MSLEKILSLEYTFYKNNQFQSKNLKKGSDIKQALFLRQEKTNQIRSHPFLCFSAEISGEGGGKVEMVQLSSKPAFRGSYQ